MHTHTPITDAYITAAADAAAAAAAYEASIDYEAPATAAYIAAAAAAAAAEDRFGRARDAWLASDEPRDWQVGGESWGNAWGEVVRMIRPSEIEAALQDSCRNASWSNDKTMWLSDWACPLDPATEDCTLMEFRVEVTTTIEVDEPECAVTDHDWHAPSDSVVGHGGGVIMKEVCAHCGLQKITDTWAQNPSTGEQGLTSVTYKEAE